MKVAQLIELLQQENPNAEVMIDNPDIQVYQTVYNVSASQDRGDERTVVFIYANGH